MQPQRLIGLALVIVGVVMLILGIRATDSFSSQVSHFFTGSPTDHAIWMLMGGVAAIIIGAAASALPSRAVAR